MNLARLNPERLRNHLQVAVRPAHELLIENDGQRKLGNPLATDPPRGPDGRSWRLSLRTQVAIAIDRARHALGPAIQLGAFPIGQDYRVIVNTELFKINRFRRHHTSSIKEARARLSVPATIKHAAE